MGGRTTARVAERLIAHGLTPETPVAVAASVTQVDEAVWAGCLGDLQEGGSPLGIDRPVLIGVGQVFAEVRCAAIGAAVEIPYQSSVS